MTDMFSEERSSEDTTVATRSSLATAEKGSLPSHSLLLVLRSWIPKRLEVMRKAPAMRAVEGWFCPGIKRERARRGRRYSRWLEILSPEEEMFEASASDPMIVSAAKKLNCASKTFGGIIWRTA